MGWFTSGSPIFFGAMVTVHTRRRLPAGRRALAWVAQAHGEQGRWGTGNQNFRGKVLDYKK